MKMTMSVSHASSVFHCLTVDDLVFGKLQDHKFQNFIAETLFKKAHRISIICEHYIFWKAMRTTMISLSGFRMGLMK